MTERQKTLAWRRIQAQRNRFTRALSKDWHKALMAQVTPVINEINESSIRDLEARIPMLITEDPIEAQLMNTIEVVGIYFAQATYKDISKALRPERITRKLGGMPTNEQWLNTLIYQLGNKAGNRITAITDHSRDEAIRVIKNTLQEGAKQGLGTSQMSQLLRDELRDQWGHISTYRAARIARTEVTMASNLGSLTGAQMSGEPMLKEWVSTRDSRTRRGAYDHYGKYPSGPDGEKREMEEMFIKTGEALKYPGDYGGSAGNVIHCRCTMVYVPKQEDQEADVIEPPTIEPPKPRPVPRPRPKPSGGTRAARVKSAREKLKSLEDAAYKKTAKLRKEYDDLEKILSEKYGQYKKLKRDLSMMPRGATRYEEIYNQYNAVISEYQALYNRHLELEKVLNLAEEQMLEKITPILSTGGESNIRFVYSKAVPVKKRKYIENYQKILGNIKGYNNLEQHIKYHTSVGRAKNGGIKSYLYSNSGAGTFCHEFGHGLEYQIKEVHDQVLDLLEKRCKGEKMVPFRKGEPVWEDQWLTAYTGRGYHYMARVGATYRPELLGGQVSEVFSMWWTELIKDPVRLVTKDPEFFEWGYDMILKLQGIQ